MCIGVLLPFWDSVSQLVMFIPQRLELEKRLPIQFRIVVARLGDCWCIFSFSVKQAERQCDSSHCIWNCCWPGLLQQLVGASEFQELFLVDDLGSRLSSSGHKRPVPCGVAPLLLTASSEAEVSSGFAWIYPGMDGHTKARLRKFSARDTRGPTASKRRHLLIIFWRSFFRETFGM